MQEITNDQNEPCECFFKIEYFDFLLLMFGTGFGYFIMGYLMTEATARWCRRFHQSRQQEQEILIPGFSVADITSNNT